MAIFVAQGVDAVAQGQEGAVDVRPLFQPLTPVLSLKDRHAHKRELGKTELFQVCSFWTIYVFRQPRVDSEQDERATTTLRTYCLNRPFEFKPT